MASVVIAACFPAMRPLIDKWNLLPRLFADTLPSVAAAPSDLHVAHGRRRNHTLLTLNSLFSRREMQRGGGFQHKFYCIEDGKIMPVWRDSMGHMGLPEEWDLKFGKEKVEVERVWCPISGWTAGPKYSEDVSAAVPKSPILLQQPEKVLKFSRSAWEAPLPALAEIPRQPSLGTKRLEV